MADTYTLADLMEEQRTLGGPPALPDVRPREMRTPALGQSNLVDRALSSFGQPSLDALRRGYAGEATPQEVARTFLETGPVGPFGMARVPRPASAEWPTSAAVRIGDRTFTGNSHFDAVTAAQRELGENALAGSNVAADGFLTNQGRYVSREDAGRMLDQLNDTRHYRTLFGNDRGLLSEALELYNPATGREMRGSLSRSRSNDTTKGGAPGIRYLDQGPEIIEILRKYGIIAPPVGAAATTLSEEPRP